MSQFRVELPKSSLSIEEIKAAISNIKTLLTITDFHSSIYGIILPGFRAALKADIEVSKHVASRLNLANDTDCEEFLAMILSRPGCKKCTMKGFEFKFNPEYVLSMVSKHNAVFSHFIKNGAKTFYDDLFKEFTNSEFDILLENGLMTQGLNAQLIDYFCENMPAKSISFLIKNMGALLAARKDYPLRVARLSHMLNLRFRYDLTTEVIAELNATKALVPKTYRM